MQASHTSSLSVSSGPSLRLKARPERGVLVLGVNKGYIPGVSLKDGTGSKTSFGCVQRFRQRKCHTRVNAGMTSLGSHGALTPTEYLSLIQHRPILGFSNPFTAAPTPPPNFFENLTTNPVQTLSQNPLNSLNIQGPSFGGVLGFLLSNPLITLILAVSLYILIPRLWRLLVKWVFIPAGLVGAGVVVWKNPSFFTNAGSFVAGFSTDHPYITSAAILGTLGIILSPYVLTALVLLLVFTGVPKLPAPLRGFLPAPFLEVEESLRSADSVIRGPVEKAKEQAFRAGDDFREKGFDFLGQKIQSLPAPQVSEEPVRR